MTYSFFLFGTSLLFHVQFELLLPDLPIGFSRGRSGGLVFPSLSEFSTVYCDPVKGFGIVNKAEIDVFLVRACFFHDPVDVGNLISGSSAFSKTSLNIWKFTVHLKRAPSISSFQFFLHLQQGRTNYFYNLDFCLFIIHAHFITENKKMCNKIKVSQNSNLFWNFWCLSLEDFAYSFRICFFMSVIRKFSNVFF